MSQSVLFDTLQNTAS